MSQEPFTLFLYLLMRDQLPAGEVERVVMNVAKAFAKDKVQVHVYSCKHLEAKAQAMSDQIRALHKGEDDDDLMNRERIIWGEYRAKIVRLLQEAADA